jgi:hypothetical protein
MCVCVWGGGGVMVVHQRVRSANLPLNLNHCVLAHMLCARFCRGVTLKHPDAAKALGGGDRGATEVLHTLGKLVCADMLVNNYDRTPAIWDHEGNANNILIDVRGGDGSVAVWGIDQVPCPLGTCCMYTMEAQPSRPRFQHTLHCVTATHPPTQPPASTSITSHHYLPNHP